MPEPYPIVEVQEEWAIDDEFLGTKDKFWYSPPNQNTDWLFKYPRPNSGEHWAEKIAAEVADLLGVLHAKVELATFQEYRGSVSESFTRGNRELIHGNEVLAGAIPTYDADAKRGQTLLTLDNIRLALERKFESQKAGEIAKRHFAGYLTLDALIGNMDRHHENWGVHEVRLRNNRSRIFIAPSFDHASSLGRELQDRRREMLLSENRIGAYVERGRARIYWSEAERHPPSPIELVRRAVQAYPAEFQTTMLRLEQVNEDLLIAIVGRIPDDWMSSSARKYATALMRYNLGELRKAFQ